MAKKVGYEVVARRPVCVDFRDGRTVSFRPGQRFVAERSNTSVSRLVRNRDVRQLSPYETVPALPVKLGAPHRVQTVVKVRAQLEAAKKAAQARMAASKKAPPEIEEAKPVPAPATPRKKKPKKPTAVAESMPQPEADK